MLVDDGKELREDIKKHNVGRLELEKMEKRKQIIKRKINQLENKIKEMEETEMKYKRTN